MTNPNKPGFDAAIPKNTGTFDVSQQVLDHQSRLAILEERSKSFATKSDLKDIELQITKSISESMQKVSESTATQTRWVIGTCIACMGFVIAVTKDLI